jgi:Transposase
VPPTPTSKEETVALPTLPHPQVLVTLGVDTHADSHVAAALDQAGRPLGTRTISTTPGGYATLLAWASTLGRVDRVGVEGTGSYGAGLARWLRAHGQLVVEVDRPDRAPRRRQGRLTTSTPTRPPGRSRPAPRPGSPRPATARWR